jgi:hypothetical protein
MKEARVREEHNARDKLEDISEFYGYSARWIGATGPKGKELKVLNPVYRGEKEKIVAGTIQVGFDGAVRLPKGTERAIYSPVGSISVRYPSYHHPYLVDVRNEGNEDAHLTITCIGSWSL